MVSNLWFNWSENRHSIKKVLKIEGFISPCNFFLFFKYNCPWCELGSSVGIATELRARRSGIECRWEREFPPVQIGPGAHPASCKMGTGSFPGVKCDQGVLLTTHPLLAPRSWKSRAIPLPTLWAKPGLQRGNFTFLPLTVRYKHWGRSMEKPLTQNVNSALYSLKPN